MTRSTRNTKPATKPATKTEAVKTGAVKPVARLTKVRAKPVIEAKAPETIEAPKTIEPLVVTCVQKEKLRDVLSKLGQIQMSINKAIEEGCVWADEVLSGQINTLVDKATAVAKTARRNALLEIINAPPLY